ncbi:MAG TPA: S8 family serine peptidase [Acidimicrobiia bacterium]|nr:S8 family serine peptidase [Acidimicrobiia bacterium]
MRKRTALMAVLAALTSLLAATGPSAAQTSGDLSTRDTGDRLSGTVSDAFELRSPDDVVQVFIQLDEPSVAEFAAETSAGRAAQQAQGRAVLAQQAELRSALGSLIVEERSSLAVGANGIRAMVRAGDIPAVRATDGVESVATVTRYHLTNETSVPWIGGETLQDAGFTGDGVSIAIIDTGIDYTHSSLGGSGDPQDYTDNDPGVVESGTFPTAKVVGGFDFAGPTYDADEPSLATPSPDPDPLDVNGHGTHVAGTAAGMEVPDDVGEGMAPDANLYAFKVFGDVAGSTELVSDAIERALDPNNDLSMDDAVDVINMSLGAPYGNPQDPSAIASQNAVENGVVVVASAGNEGTPPYVTGSPAVAPDVISVAASIDGGAEVLAMPVNSPAEIAGQYEAQAGDFGPLDPPTDGDLAIAAPLDACNPITSDVEGKIALIQRGTCEFTVKVRNAEDAGAIGALVFNNVEGPPIGMAHNGTEPKPTIPAMMIGLADGELIHTTAASETVNVTLTDDVTLPKPDLADNMAGFTSRGPGFDNVFKPDLSAPGFSIGSADVGSGSGLTLNSGTSMAAPHVAGAAAQLLDWNDGLTPAQVKALLMNSATPANVEGPVFTAGAVPVASQGTGIIHVDKVVEDLQGYTTPGGLVFHLNPTTETSDTRTVTIHRLDGEGEATYDVEVEPNQQLDGVTWEVSSSSVSTSGGSGSVDVTVTVNPAALASDDGFFSQAESDGWLRLTNTEDADDTMVVGLVAVADPASTVTAAGGEAVVSLTNDGPGDGFADGFTNTGAEGETVAAVGFRTGFVAEADGGPYDTIDFGVALAEAWSSPSANEIDILLDVDEDGTDEYAVVAADLGALQNAAPTGQVVTALFDLVNGGGFLLYFAVGDLNDRVITLPADLTGDFGFLEEGDTSFDMTVAVFDQVGLVGVSETIPVDLTSEITPDGGPPDVGADFHTFSLVLPADGFGEVATEGAGDLLWLFQNNTLADQFSITTVTAAEPPAPPPPGEPPSFDDVPDDHLFHQEITWLAEQGITRGCNPPANDLFCPDDSVTRGQMAAFLNRALDLASTTEDFFVDDDSSVFEGDINRLAAADITRGCNPPANDEYCPGDTLSRAQMATFMMRGFGFADGAGSDLFVDDDGNIHEDAIDIIGTADVTRGCNPPANDMFCPDEDITRGQMAAFLFRAFQTAGLED